MASEKVKQEQDVEFPSSAPDLNEELGSNDLNHSTGFTGRVWDTLPLFPHDPASHALPMRPSPVEGTQTSFSRMMSPYQQTDGRRMMAQDSQQEVPLTATPTAAQFSLNSLSSQGNPFYQDHFLPDNMIPEDKGMNFIQTSDLEKAQVYRDTIPRAGLMDGGLLVPNVGNESISDTETMLRLSSGNVPTHGFGAGYNVETRPNSGISRMGSTGPELMDVDNRRFSTSDLTTGFTNPGNNAEIFNRSQPNRDGVTFLSGLSNRHNEVPFNPINDQLSWLLQDVSGFPQPTDNDMFGVQNMGAFPANLQNVGPTSLSQNSDAGTSSAFVHAPHPYQIPSSRNLDIQGNRAASTIAGYAPSGLWGSSAELSGLYNNNQFGFPSYGQYGLSTFPSSNSILQRSIQPASLQMTNPFLENHNDFSLGSYPVFPPMGDTRSINRQDLTGNVGLPQAIAPAQPSRDVATTTQRAGNVHANASGNVQSRKRGMPTPPSATPHAERKRTRSIKNSGQTSPSPVAAQSSTSMASPPGCNVSPLRSAFPNMSTTPLELQASLLPNAPLYRHPQSSTGALRPPHPQSALLGANTPLHHSPLAPTANFRPPQARTIIRRPPRSAMVALPRPRAPFYASRPPRASLGIADNSVNGEPKPSGMQCMICKRDLAFTPEGPISVERNLPPVSVLSCHHHFHSFCLDRITPKEQAGEPPCIPCAMGNVNLAAQHKGGAVKSKKSLRRRKTHPDLFRAIIDFIVAFFVTMFSMEKSDAYRKGCDAWDGGAGNGAYNDTMMEAVVYLEDFMPSGAVVAQMFE
ncbi:hypothetical protein LINGRAHAP2_LOCUS8503 [Linum grandiflorum]